ncbi:MAG: hypothetical protein IT462_13470 [Planctomycetes bacterium]|nr:hypothetical protein [Planctomycetota bacterium]
MRPELRRFSNWLGTWQGFGDLALSKRGHVRTQIRERLGGDCIEIVAENVLDDAPGLLNGGISLLCVAPDGGLQLVAYSTTYGAMVLREMPDDPGVLALEGIDASGTGMSVTMVLDGEQMLVTTVVRKAGGEVLARSSMTLERLRAPSDPAPEVENEDTDDDPNDDDTQRAKDKRNGGKERTSKVRQMARRMDGKR